MCDDENEALGIDLAAIERKQGAHELFIWHFSIKISFPRDFSHSKCMQNYSNFHLFGPHSVKYQIYV